MLVFRGQFAKAQPLLKKSIILFQDLGAHIGLALSDLVLGSARVHLGQYEQACAQGEMGLALSKETGYQRGAGYAYWLVGSVALVEEAYVEAQQWLQKSVAVYRRVEVRHELGRTLAVLGVAARGLGNLPLTKQHLCEALRVAAPSSEFRTLMYALSAIALLLADQGEGERAVELYALASRYPFVGNSRWFEDIAGKHIAAVAAGLPPEVVAAAQERGRARDLEATVAELLAELEC
jgi:tetratricopeptide (TPR) repeat protein